MTITVSGILRDSGGNPAKNDIIKFYTEQGFNGALPSATLEVVTTSTGAYDFELSVGVHLLSVQYNDVLTKVGKITVTSDMSSPQTLESLLAFDEPLLPDEIIIVQQLVSQATEAANSASDSADKAAQSEQEVESDRKEVATNTAAVEQNAQDVESARSEVAQNAQTVANNTQTVSEKTQIVVDAQTDVTTKAQQVSDDAAQVAQDKSDTAASALLAQMWAIGNDTSGTQPSDTNNAKYWSDRAAQFAMGTLSYGGLFTPTAENSYPPVAEIDTIYLVNFDDGSETFTYTTGDLSGKTVKNGNIIIYNVRPGGAEYEASSFVFTGVTTVNGKEPDSAGAVSITSEDTGANALILSLLKSRIGDIISKPPNTADNFDASHARLQGQLLSREDNSLLWDWITDTQGDQLVSDTEWQSLKASSYNGAVSVFSTGDGSTTFRMLDEGDGGFDRSTGNVTDPVLLNIGFQDQVEDYSHTIIIKEASYGGEVYSNILATTNAVRNRVEGAAYAAGSLGAASPSLADTRTELAWGPSIANVNTGDEVQPKGQYRKYFMYTGDDLQTLMPQI